jgi:hypothetical protein
MRDAIKPFALIGVSVIAFTGIAITQEVPNSGAPSRSVPVTVPRSQEAQRLEKQTNLVPSPKVILKEGTAVVFRLVGKITSENGEVPAKLEVAVDVKAGGLVVIPRGAEAVFSVAKTNAQVGGQPGPVVLEFAAVPSVVTGEEIALSGRYEAKGDAGGCLAALDCLLEGITRPFLKGAIGKFDAGILVPAAVREGRELEEYLLGKQIEPVGKSRTTSLIHIYHLRDSVPNKQYSFGNKDRIQLDRHHVGNISELTYGCLEVPPGRHVMRVNKSELVLDAEANENYYARIIELVAGSSHVDTLLNLTDGYDLDGEILKTTGLNKPDLQESKFGSSACWN